jgi:uncharacterized protein (TIGR02271 family)
MLRQEEIRNLAGRAVYDRKNDKIGKAGQIYLNGYTNQPEWLGIQTGLFGMRESFVPLGDAQLKGDNVHVAYDKEQVKDAPQIDAGAEGMSGHQVEQLYGYYGRLGWQAPQPGARGTQEAARQGRMGDEQVMTRSEERLRIGTEQHESGHARLHKHVTTEQVQQSVPVHHERARIEREPITAQNRDTMSGQQQIAEAEQQVTLREERPTVQKETVPVEKVRLGKETVTGEETVGDEIRKEQIETDVPQQSR